MDKKEIRKQLWNSLDMIQIRANMILVAVVCLLTLPAYLQAREIGWMIQGVIFFTLEGALLWQVWRIYRKPEGYVFHPCKLTVFHNHRWMRRFYYFTVVTQNRNGKDIAVDTEPIFGGWGFGAMPLEDYMDTTVTIGYNDETYHVVVIE